MKNTPALMCHKYKKIVNEFSGNKDIVIMKQDKGSSLCLVSLSNKTKTTPFGGAVVIDRAKYFGKCLSMLNTEQFVQLQKNPTISLERIVQRTLREIKQKLPTDVYTNL